MLFAKTQKKKKEEVTRSGAQSEASAAGGIAEVSQIESPKQASTSPWYFSVS
jgi:hypothetical protein